MAGMAPEVHDWDTYWRGLREAAAFGIGGPQQAPLKEFWRDLFTNSCPSTTHLRVLDLACGHGIVTRQALDLARALSHPEPSVLCLDYSFAAVAELLRAFPGLLGVAADAARIPLPDSSFDAVVSQFGVEYAGPQAVAEAMRLVAPKGVFGAILHFRNGALYRECALNLSVTQAVQNSRLLELADRAFRAGFDLRDGRGSEAEFHKASADLVPAVRLLPELMRRHGQGVASGAIAALYKDLEQMYRRLSAYDAEEVLSWIGRTGTEFEAYAGRMSSMLGAALDEKAVGHLGQVAETRGFSVRLRTLHGPERPEPMAWTLVCH